MMVFMLIGIVVVVIVVIVMMMFRFVIVVMMMLHPRDKFLLADLVTQHGKQIHHAAPRISTILLL